jgi:anti-sigma factor RsiW
MLGFKATNKASNNTHVLNQSTEVINMYQRDRFELLSAYMDGEVTAAERQQIEQWLTTEPEVQCLYARVLKLRPLWSTMPVPTAQPPIKPTIKQVLPGLRNNTKMTTWAGTVLATMLLGTLSAILPSHDQSSVLTMTQALQPMAKLGL